MPSLTRAPRPQLAPFVELLWAMDERDQPQDLHVTRERMLPTGTAHVVFRLAAEPLRIYAHAHDAVGSTHRQGVVGGPRAQPYVRGIAGPTRSVGAMLRPGIAVLLLGMPAHELSDRHVDLDDLWGSAARSVQEELENTPSLDAQIGVLERFLIARLPRVRAVHPAVAHGFLRLTQGADVGQVVEESGYSHRRFIALFRASAGFSPKLFARLMRFQRALELVHGAPGLGLGRVALAAGYADQAHLTREFAEFSGLSPGEYRALAPRDAHHVPLSEPSTPAEGQIPSRPTRPPRAS